MNDQQAALVIRSLIGGGNNDDDEPRPSEIGMIATLNELAGVYMRASRFQVGQLVTPRRGVNVKGAGDPHVVVEIRENAEPELAGNPGCVTYGMRRDIRVICWTNGEYVPYWMESWMLVPYDRPE